MYLEQQKGEEDPMQIPRPLPTNKIPEVMGPAANQELACSTHLCRPRGCVFQLCKQILCGA